MIDIIQQKLIELAPNLSLSIFSVLILLFIKRTVIKYLISKIDEITPARQIQNMRNELAEIKKEILEMRGKRK